jgi:hypothetical protein
MFRTRAVLVSIVVAFIVSAVSGQGFIIRAMGGGGYTLINFEGASGYPDSSLENWDQANYSFALQGLWQVAPNIRIGGEAGWEQLYSWYYIIPYGSSGPVYRQANWATIFVGGLAQIFLTHSLYVLGGVDIHSFSGDGTAVGVSAGIGAQFRVSGKLAIPLEFRIKPVFGAGTPMVLQINTGVAFGACR